MPRAENARFDALEASNDWFDVYELVPGVYSIHEPHQWQEVISYLIVGDDKAVMFDTGNGIGDIRAIVDSLTTLPVVVVNSHAHFDHVGGNYQFDTIVSIDTAYGREHANGLPNEDVRIELSPEALCRDLPGETTQDAHAIHRYAEKITWVEDGHTIDIGGHVLEIMHAPGHSPGSIALLDRQRGYVWTGDTYYPGPIWLIAPSTDFAAYRESIRRLAELAPDFRHVFPAHNILIDDPGVLIRARDAYEKIVGDELEGKYDAELGALHYEFDGFSFLMRADHPTKW
jgi:glyoxylase-like metal-dependent hydrolase (beta-lactamase superfamily II)